MTNHAYRLLLGASLALIVGAAGAQYAPDSTARKPAEKSTISAMPAQPSAQPADKMSTDRNVDSQGVTTRQNARPRTQAALTRHARKPAARHDDVVTPQEKNYRQALRQCVRERDESQRDTCLDSAIEQRQSNG